MNAEFEQNPGLTPSPEKQELDPTASARWFAGALEAGGTVGFSIHRGKDDWAKQAGVGVHLIERHVIPKLSAEIQSSRKHLLRSQSTKDRNQSSAKDKE